MSLYCRQSSKNSRPDLYHSTIASWPLPRAKTRGFILFFNEFRSETSVKRDEKESINDRNDRTVRRAAAWYTSHLLSTKRKSPTIVVLTNDQDNRKKSQAEGLTALSLRDYVSGLDDADRLSDMVAEGQNKDVTRGELFYPEYYTMSKMTTGVKTGTLHRGNFNVSPYNYLEGTVKVPAFDKPLLILGRENSNRSVSGDSVVVEILPKDLWRAASTKVVVEEETNRNENAENEETGDVVVTENERQTLQEEVKRAHTAGGDAKAQPTARIVGVMKRNWRQFVGTVDPGAGANSGTRQTTVFLVPMDKRIPKVRVRTRQVEQLIGKRVLATIDSWDRDSRYPVGHYIRSLGELENEGSRNRSPATRIRCSISTISESCSGLFARCGT